MKILIVGGIKAVNILNGVEKHFASSGDELSSAKFIEDIEDLIQYGGYYDRILITSQSITHDNDAGLSVSYMRDKLYEVSGLLRSMCERNKCQLVFLTDSQNFADIVYEETQAVGDCSAIVMVKPPYKAKFFVSLLSTDINKLPDEWVYKPSFEEATPEVEETPDEIGDDDLEDFNYTPNFVDNPGQLFGNDDERIADQSDELNTYDSHTYTDTGAVEDEDAMEEIPDELEDEMAGVDDYARKLNEMKLDREDFVGTMASPNSDDEYIPVDVDPADFDESLRAKSGDLPNFDVKDTEEPQEFMEEPQGLEGWGDYVEEEPMNEEPTYEEPEYTEQVYEEPAYEEPTYEEPTYEEPSYDEPVGGADEPIDDMSGMYDSPAEEPKSNDELDGFGMYEQPTEPANGEDTLDEMYSNVDEYDYDNPGEPDSDEELIDDSDYSRKSKVQEQVHDEPKKKSGLLGGLFGKKHKDMEGLSTDNEPAPVVGKVKGFDLKKFKQNIKPFAAKGNSIVVTGCGGAGTSEVALNMANILNSVGYTVLLVDFNIDTCAQHYISYRNYRSMDANGANLQAAINSVSGISSYTSVVKKGFHLLTMGCGGDVNAIDTTLDLNKVPRFLNLAKTSYNFIVYDINFDNLTTHLKDAIYNCDNLVITVDSSNWGIMRFMMKMCNIASDEVRELVCSKGQLVFNRYRNLNKLLGRKIKTATDIEAALDDIVMDLSGQTLEDGFESMHIAGIINDDPEFENCWYSETQYSDTNKGKAIFGEIVENIILRK